MKRYGVIALITVLVLGLAIYFAACSGGGGGDNGGGPQIVSYGTSSQAAAGVKSMSGAVTLSSTIGDMTSGFAGGAVPPGYAPSRRARSSDTSAIANIDPRLKTTVEKMAADLKNPTIQKAIAKARALKTASALASSISISTACVGSGYYTINGTDSSSAGVYDEYTIGVTYSNCIDSTDTTTNYNVLSGSLQYHHKYRLDNTAYDQSIAATNLTLATYLSATLSVTDKTNGTLSSVYSEDTNSVQTWLDSANASYSMTFNDGYNTQFAFSMNNASNTEVYTPGTAGTYTDDNTANGSFAFSVSNNAGPVASVTLGFSNFNDKWAYNADQSEDEWLNGTISLTWTPSPGNDCMPGALKFTTAVDTPMHYTSYLDTCPSSGTVTVNNATIVYGNPVTVTVGNDIKYFSDCTFIGADTCVSQIVN